MFCNCGKLLVVVYFCGYVVLNFLIICLFFFVFSVRKYWRFWFNFSDGVEWGRCGCKWLSSSYSRCG